MYGGIYNMKYIVEYAKFMKVEIEADSAAEANDKATVINDEYIEKNGKSYEPSGYIIWNGAQDEKHEDEEV